MKDSDRYHKWVEWSDEDQVYIGKCPDLITGIHGDDPVSLYSELCSVVEDVIIHLKAEARSLPAPKVRPMGENGDRQRFSLNPLIRIGATRKMGQVQLIFFAAGRI
ncbi:hypothetical protein [uncultured Thiodictyon sp.]|uniref:hypothetical protein n=1 Tax=uncultured Thiodictyon sp. TaxID=1846217 RepID=UPI00345449C0